MAETSGFFRSVSGDRKYTTDWLAKWVSSFIGTGVYDGDLAVTAGDGMAIALPAGKAWINGYYYRNDAPITLPIANADGVLHRKDTVVLRWDVNERTISAQVIKGAFASTPVAPAIVRSVEQYDLKIAEVSIPAGTTVITNALITDTRLDKSVCGIVTSVIDQVDTTTFYNQIVADLAQFKSTQQADFEAWFESIKDILDDNTAGNLLNLINEHTADSAAHITTAAHTKTGTTHNLTVPTGAKNLTFLATANFTEADSFKVNGVSVPASMSNGESLPEGAFQSGKWASCIYDGAQLNFPAGSSKQQAPDYAGKLFVNVTSSDGGTVAGTRVRVRNEQLGANFLHPLNALNQAEFNLLENYTYYVYLIDYPSAYYGAAAVVTVTGGETQTITLQLKTEPDVVGWRVKDGSGTVEYTDGASNFMPMQMQDGELDPGSWAESWLVRNIKPGLLKNGVPQYYLKKTAPLTFDYSTQANGDAADVTTGDDGDVMIFFPLVYYKFYEQTVGSDRYVGCKFSLTPQDDTWCANAFLNRSGVPQEYMCMAAYDGSEVGGKLRSLSGYAPSNNKTIGAYRALATANGAGYEQQEWSKRAFLQAMFPMLFKSKDCQAALGKGTVSAPNAIISGTLNDKPLCWGDQTGTNGVKFLGIEHFWGNIRKWCDGLGLISSDYKYKVYAPYNDAMTGYLSGGADAGTSGYIVTTKNANGYGILPKATESSDGATGWHDYYYRGTGTYVCNTGGHWGSGLDAGAWCCDLSSAASYAGAFFGSSLSFTPQ